MHPLKVLLIDDHALFRTGLRLLLADRWPDSTLHEAATVEAVMAQPPVGVDLVLLDLQLPGVQGLPGLALLRGLLGEVPMVMVSANDDEALVAEARLRGAAGFIAKSMSADRLVEALLQACQGLAVWPEAVILPCAGGVADAHPAGWLPSDGQRKILSLLGRHKSNKALARALGCSEHEVRAEVSTLMERLGVVSRAAAHQSARQRGWAFEAGKA